MEARARGKRCRTSGLRTENREYKPPAPGTARWNDMLKRIAKAKKAEAIEAAWLRGETIDETKDIIVAGEKVSVNDLDDIDDRDTEEDSPDDLEKKKAEASKKKEVKEAKAVKERKNLKDVWWH